MLGGADNPNGELPSYITGADMVANSELFALVQEYNRIARTCGMDELRITHLG